ncbi:uncharacterized protein LOC113237719 isoform X2 [Hyposmocoma kahamanoa]|nr:uncharacterized protein LOC113237719 isoform X2 [Hyposmocoma kahamanoa]
MALAREVLARNDCPARSGSGSGSRSGSCVHQVHLVMAKSRVAPIKPTTVPRLELSGSLLAARLVEKLKISQRVYFRTSKATEMEQRWRTPEIGRNGARKR